MVCHFLGFFGSCYLTYCPNLVEWWHPEKEGEFSAGQYDMNKVTFFCRSCV
jgi:hypothetical protein